jgi:hypothetical protein
MSDMGFFPQVEADNAQLFYAPTSGTAVYRAVQLPRNCGLVFFFILGGGGGGGGGINGGNGGNGGHGIVRIWGF